MENCNECWWYCHGDSKCYRGTVVGVSPKGTCDNWHFDGLKDWERVMETLLMAMEERS